MSWEYVVMASAVASAASSYAGASIQAKAGAKASRMKAEQSQTNKSMVELQAMTQESDRIKEYARLVSSNTNSVSYDPYSSPSFLAIDKESSKEVNKDISQIRLMGKTKAENYEKQAEIDVIEGDAFRSMGRTAWLQPAGTLLGGAYKAKRVKA